MTSGTALEQEAKFWVPDLETFRRHVERRGAVLVTPRTHEYNLRFDTPEGRLSREHRVLRLRRDRRITLTYKGPAQRQRGVQIRPEYEVEVDDFDAARRLLEGLGFRVALAYEKYRTQYRWQDVHLVLDELPYGNFVEIEGPSLESVHRAARALGLDLDAAVPWSYVALFRRLKDALQLDAAHLTFEAFRNRPVDWTRLGLRPAWTPQEGPS